MRWPLLRRSTHQALLDDAVAEPREQARKALELVDVGIVPMAVDRVVEAPFLTLVRVNTVDQVWPSWQIVWPRDDASWAAINRHDIEMLLTDYHAAVRHIATPQES